MLMIVFQIIQLLGRQGLPLRGHISEESNFIHLMRLRALLEINGILRHKMHISYVGLLKGY